jgi:hypothetical protein
MTRLQKNMTQFQFSKEAIISIFLMVAKMRGAVVEGRGGYLKYAFHLNIIE